MFLAILAAAATSLLLWLYLRWTHVRGYWTKRGVPHTPPHPLLGSLTFLMKVNAGIWMRDLYRQFDSPYVGIWLFWRPALVVNDPHIAKRILVKDSDVFRDRTVGSGTSDPIGSLNIFTANDPLWTMMRKRLSPVFTAAKLRRISNISLVKSKELCQRIQNDVDKKLKIDLRMTFSVGTLCFGQLQDCISIEGLDTGLSSSPQTMFADFTTDVIGTLSFGVASDATLTGDSALRRITLDFQRFSLWRGLSWASIFFWPELVDVFRFKFFPKHTTAFFTNMFRSVLASRGGYGGYQGVYDTHPYQGESRDLLDALVKIKVDADHDKGDVTETMLIAQAAILLQGGYDTSATVLTFCVYELAYHPEIQENLFLELEAAKEELDDKDFDINTLSSLNYLNAVIKESLRIYSPMGWLDRIAGADYKIDDHVTVPKGMTVYVNAMGMQHDPRYFPHPERFDPGRFLPENEGNIKPFTYMPFGEGPRNCIGMRLGLNNVRMALAHVLLRFQVWPHPGERKNDDSAIEKKGLFFTPGSLYSVQFQPRESP